MPHRFARTASTALTSAVAALLVAACAAPAANKPVVVSMPDAAVSAAPAAVAPPAPSLAVNPSSPPGFADWLAKVRETALGSGMDAATLDQAFGGVQFLPRVVELDGRQPEFTRPVWEYLDTAVSQQRIRRGQEKWQEVQAQADAAAARYGVPASIVMAIWGMESNYGSNYGDIPTIDALATLGFEGRREDWARGQLLAALKILQNRDIDREHMIGSWAGAMGQTQFLPSAFLAYAVDADGDGRRDIWGSMADVTASTANFLARSGWRANEPWGFEVRLPAGFDLARADPRVKQSSAQWQAEGLAAAQGDALPALSDGYILLPAGAGGPAFLVGPNFGAILRYNNSISYALGVGLLSQRLAGGPGVMAAWPRQLVNLSRSQLLSLQTALNQRGFPSGTPDGMMGPATRDGIRAYQRSLGNAPDGYPTLELLQRLQP
ncbi:lytic murein transglycosylase [Xylophilus rhododendri]|uniref:Lytic murein transglycosylase n=1 Tax=Xylophilus rhododendri TaxID=2697032 RepID=A0A857IZQ6_9BURK|nr:lytic murein transglycosylase [Xylophilus rhododendri]QHI97084.1 lytic murein transglycosylase [Xylophilus rhododendri]